MKKMTDNGLITHFHLFCGLGGGAKGFQDGEARVGALQARFECLGGVDNDPSAIRDFGALVGVPGTVLDLFDRDQYAAWHGSAPPPSWREATADDLRRAAQGRRPNIVFLSAPCKGFSGLLSGERSASAKYQALNQLALRGLLLTLAAWGDDPPELILFENVPRIAGRGRQLLDEQRHNPAALLVLLKEVAYRLHREARAAGLTGLQPQEKALLEVVAHFLAHHAGVTVPKEVAGG